MARKKTSSEAPGVESLPDLPRRLTYSLLKAAVRVAARANIPMAEVVDLVQLAYFEELRRRHPRDLKKISESLGLSLRSVGSLNRRLRRAFFAAETKVQPARRVSAALLDGPKTLTELRAALSELSAADVRAAISTLRDNGWLKTSDRRYSLTSRLRSYVDEDLSRRIDALNNQMEILAASVWARFIDKEETAVGRSWVFAAQAEELVPFIDQTIRALRHGAIDLEESALQTEEFERYGVTLAFAKVGEKKT